QAASSNARSTVRSTMSTSSLRGKYDLGDTYTLQALGRGHSSHQNFRHEVLGVFDPFRGFIAQGQGKLDLPVRHATHELFTHQDRGAFGCNGCHEPAMQNEIQDSGR